MIDMNNANATKIDDANPPPMNVPTFRQCKANRGSRLTVLTCYDYSMAKLFDACGVDCLLVGDSVGTVVQGRDTTLSVTLDQMAYHTEMVARAASRALVIGDMPFLSYHTSIPDAIRNAGRLIQECGADAVKLEGGRSRSATIAALVDAEIPVMGHIGLTPQSIRKLGTYRVQRDESRLLDDAQAVEDSGAFAMVLESVPREIARKITERVSIPTIGIGAGPDCDGQVLVWQDAFGLTSEFKAKFVKHYADLHGILTKAVGEYCNEVRSGKYPDDGHSYH